VREKEEKQLEMGSEERGGQGNRGEGAGNDGKGKVRGKGRELKWCWERRRTEEGGILVYC